jgi:hypothetical protein
LGLHYTVLCILTLVSDASALSISLGVFLQQDYPRPPARFPNHFVDGQ